MRASPASPISKPSRPAAPDWKIAALVLIAIGAFYANSVFAPFVFDDLPGIVENPTIRRFQALTAVLAPQSSGGLTVSGRPIVNLSLALNYAVSGFAPWSYHVANLLIHAGAALLLFGIVRRTLLTGFVDPRFRASALPLSMGVAALWMLHPLQTESVTYTIQRAESLCSFFYLGTLYAFIRSAESDAARRWSVLAILSCLLGMATKEVMASAPLIMLLYDRTFLTGSFRRSWVEHRRIHLGFATTWLLLAMLVFSTENRGGTTGFFSGVSAWEYLLTQSRAILLYLRLTFWPTPLVFDYGLSTVKLIREVWPQVLLIMALLVGTTWALVRRPVVGFLGAAFFLLLAPSSSFIPVATQTIAEHRMYLALSPVITAAVGLLFLLSERVALTAVTVLAFAFGALTAARNQDYRSALSLWGDTATKFPSNARAHNNLGQAQFTAGDAAGSIASYSRALKLQPKYFETHYNLGVSLAQLGRTSDAIRSYETALELEPKYPEAENNLGNALVKLGKIPEAVGHYESALRQRPGFAEAHNNLGNALLALNRAPEATTSLRRALELKPDYAEAYYNLGNALAALGNMSEALEQYRAALREKPTYTEAHVNAGNALLQLGRASEAIVEYQEAVTLSPRLAEAHFNLGSALLQLERWAESVPPLQTAARLNPSDPDIHRALAYALEMTGRGAEAIPHYEIYTRAHPEDVEVREAVSKLRSILSR